MSMLAERNRKTKWVINPTKKPLWTQDSYGIKFGKELMEKMGWSAGRGLGSREQGIQEPLRVSYKNDTKGMGFKGNDDNWIEHQDEFNVLLSQLSNNDDTSAVENSDIQKPEVKSLELKSKHSRARVHYQKFTRGKDLSNYSENDLACILGINKPKKEKSTPEVVTKTKAECDYETSFGVTTINSGSIQDYFKKKWTLNKTKSSSSFKAGEEAENYSECCPDSKPILLANEEGNGKPDGKEARGKKRKHKNRQHEADNVVYETAKQPDRGEELKNSPEAENGIKEKKHKKRKTKSEAELLEIEDTERSEVNDMDIPKKKDKKKEVKIAEMSFEVTKIKKKKKCDNSGDNENKLHTSGEKSHCSTNSESFAISKERNVKVKHEEKISKKEKCKSKPETEEIIQEATENVTVNDECRFSEERKSKKKKHKSNQNSKIVTSGMEETQGFQIGNTDKFSEEHEERSKQLAEIKEEKQKTKEKKRKKIFGDQFPNGNQMNTFSENKQFSCAIQGECNSSSEMVDKKSKKRKHKSKSETEEINSVSFATTNEVFEEKKAKKRKHKSKSDDGSLEKKDGETSELDDLMNCTDTLNNKHKNKKKRIRISSEGLHDSVTAESMDLNYQTTESSSLGNGNDVNSTKKRNKDKKNHPRPEIPEGDQCFEANTERTKRLKPDVEDYSNQDVLSSELNGKEVQEFHLTVGSVRTSTDLNERGISEEATPGKMCTENETSESKENLEVETARKEKSEKRETVKKPNTDKAEECIPEHGSGEKKVAVSDVKAKELTHVKGRQTVGVSDRKEALYDLPEHRYTSERVLDLICWADIKEFKGSNLLNVMGYGFKKDYLRNKMR